MKKLELLFSNEIVLEDSRRMKLDYSLTENYPEEECGEPYYGVQITKYLGEAVETDEVSGVSYRKDTVISMIQKLFQFEVTPISMAEIIDDFITIGAN